MRESSIVVRPEQAGTPHYSQSSRLNAAGLRSAISVLERFADEVPLPQPHHPIVIADYGAGDGHNSLLPLTAVIGRLRARTRPEHAVLVAHTDLATNDFTALFQTLADDPDSYLKYDSATFPSAIGRSFYQQIMPSASVTVGWSAWAVQWLRRVPVPVPDHIHVAYSAADTVRSAYARQAAEDWHEFIAFRGRELRPNGRLVVLTMGVDEDGNTGLRQVIQALAAELDAMCADGVLTEDELAGISLPMVSRSAKDFVAPFAPKGRFEGLSVEHLEVFDAEDRYWAQYRVDRDAEAFGARWAAFARASVFPLLAGGLDCADNGSRRAVFADRLERGLARRLAADPQQAQIPMALVVLHKAGS